VGGEPQGETNSFVFVSLHQRIYVHPLREQDHPTPQHASTLRLEEIELRSANCQSVRDLAANFSPMLLVQMVFQGLAENDVTVAINSVSLGCDFLR
jgi:hypothetical protein